MPIQTAIDSISNSQGSPFGFKNRIINGAMVIDQRNAGASVTANDGVYAADRWRYESSQSSKFTVGQNIGSVTPPVGFSKYIGVTSSSAYSILTTDRFNIGGWIEGYNTADFEMGTSNAKTFTLSFWVRSSLTGTFGGACLGYDSTNFRNYSWNYTITSANTWEYKTITIPGDTGTFNYGKTNNWGIFVSFSLGHGSNYTSTPGTWGDGLKYAPTSHTSVVGTNTATWYVTGVQLEKGSTATSFDYRPIGTELSLCQRYYHKNYPQTTAPADSAAMLADGIGATTVSDANSVFSPNIPYPVCMRATPTFTFYRTPNSATSGMGAAYNGVWQTGTSTALRSSSDNRFSMYITKTATFTAGYSYLLEYAYSATAEL